MKYLILIMIMISCPAFAEAIPHCIINNDASGISMTNCMVDKGQPPRDFTAKEYHQYLENLKGPKNPPLRPHYNQPIGCQILKTDSEGNVTKYKDCHLYRNDHKGDWFLKDNERKEHRYKP